MRESETKEVLLDKLIGIQDLEAVKPIQDMDTDLIAECTEYIIKLTGEELPSESALEQMKLRLLQRLFGRNGSVPKYRKGMLRKLLIAAIVVILIAAMAVSLTQLGTNDESLLQRWEDFFWHAEQGSQIEIGDYVTLIKGGRIEKYTTVRQFIRKAGMDILVPTEIPDGYTIKKVQVQYDNVFECLLVSFVSSDPANLSINVFIEGEKGDLEKREKTEQIGNYYCGISYAPQSCQCEFNYEGNGYTIVARSYNDARLIVENMKGSIRK